MLTICDVTDCEEVKSLVKGVQKYIDNTENFMQHINNVSKKAGEILEILRIS